MQRCDRISPLFDGKKTISQIAKEVKKSFDVSYERVYKDILDLSKDLFRGGFMDVIDSDCIKGKNEVHK